jgi:HEAT repeat protein
MRPVHILSSFAALLALLTGCSDREATTDRQEAALIGDLRHPSVSRRHNAIRQLGERRSKAAVVPLCRSLGDAREDLRVTAAESLALIGDPRAVPALSAMAAAGEWRQRRVAIEALGTIGDPTAIPALAAALTNAEPSVSMAAATSLGKFGARAVPSLQAALKDPRETVRQAAVYGLGRAGDRSITAALSEFLGDPAGVVRLAVAEALARLGDAASAPHVARLLTDRDASVRAGARKVVPKFGAGAIPSVAPLLDSEDPALREAIVRVLTDIGTPEITVPLLRATGDPHRKAAEPAETWLRRQATVEKVAAALLGALSHTQATIRVQAIRTVEACDVPTPPASLYAALEDCDAGVRVVAARLIERAGDKSALDRLFARLEDPSRDVAMAAAAAMAAMGDTRANTFLRSLLNDRLSALTSRSGGPNAPSDYAAQRRQVEDAVRGLGLTRDRASVGVLMSLLKHSDSHLVVAAIEALGLIGDPQAVPPLLDLLKMPFTLEARAGDSPLRVATVALGRIGDPRAFEPLVTLMEKAEHRWWAPIREPAAEALVRVDPKRAALPLANRLRKTESFDTAQISHLCALLGRTGDPLAVPVLGPYLLSDIATSRGAAANALKAIGGTREGIDAIIAQMKLAGAGKRSAFAIVLAELGHPVFDPLVAALKDAAPETRHGAAWSLGYLRDPRAVTNLIAALRDPHENVQAAAAWALGELKNPAALEPLTALAAGPGSLSRIGAVEGIGALGGPAAYDALLPLLTRDTNAEVRAVCATALGRADDPRAAESLRIASTNDPVAAVRQSATRALAELRKRREGKTGDPATPSFSGKPKS